MVEELDLLSGAEAIASFLGIKVRRVYHLVETQRLPIFRIGSTLCARRSTLRGWVEDLERMAVTHVGHPVDDESV